MRTNGWESQEKQLRKNLAVNVRKLRELRGLSLEDAAHEGHMNWRHWQKVEAGVQSATLRTVAKLSVALEVKPFELLKPRKSV